MIDLRDEWIGLVVADRSFADVGGLWGTVNEKVSVAAAKGAAELAMIDASPEDGALWQRFDAHLRERGIERCRRVASDVCAVQGLAFDVVHCSGVLYHHPSPQEVLAALHRLTREHLVLTSAVTPSVVANARGRYEIPPSGVIFVPALSAAEREILAEHWRGAGATAEGITEPGCYRPGRFAPWWWLPTEEALAAMVEAAGFEILAEGPLWSGKAKALLLRPREQGGA